MAGLQHVKISLIDKGREEQLFFDIHLLPDCADYHTMRFGRRKAWALLNAIEANGSEAFIEALEDFIGAYKPDH